MLNCPLQKINVSYTAILPPSGCGVASKWHDVSEGNTHMLWATCVAEQVSGRQDTLKSVFTFVKIV